MDNFKKYWLLYLLIILVILFVFAYKNNWFGIGLIGSSSVKINSTGADPNPADCGEGVRHKKTDNTLTTLACTSPLYATGKIAQANGVKEVKERCFTIDQFNGVLTESDMSEGTSIKLPYPYNNTTWHYNRQMGDKFCFVDNTDYPCTSYNCNP